MLDSLAALVTVPLAGTHTALFISSMLVLLNGQRVQKCSIMLRTRLIICYVHIVPFCSEGAVRKLLQADTEVSLDYSFLPICPL